MGKAKSGKKKGGKGGTRREKRGKGGRKEGEKRGKGRKKSEKRGKEEEKGEGEKIFGRFLKPRGGIEKGETLQPPKAAEKNQQ